MNSLENRAEGIIDPIDLTSLTAKCYALFRSREIIKYENNEEAIYSVYLAAEEVVEQLEESGYGPQFIFDSLAGQTQVLDIHRLWASRRNWEDFYQDVSVSIIESVTKERFPDCERIEGLREATHRGLLWSDIYNFC